MRLIFASGTPVLREKSKFKIGSEDEEYRFERKWWVCISLRLEREEGDKASHCATLSKILTGVSWDMRMDVRVRKTSEENLHAANLKFQNCGGGYSQLESFLKLFRKTIEEKESSKTLLEIKLGKSNSIQFKDYHVFGNAEPSDVDEDLTQMEALKLVMVEDKDVRITWEESFNTGGGDGICACANILFDGVFADCHLVSNQEDAVPCHRAVLKDHSAKFKKEIAKGNTMIEVDLSTSGVRALLRFLYYGDGDLNDAIGNWKLSVELLKVAHSHGIHNLWNAIVDVLMEMEEEPGMKTAAEGFQIIVKSGKLETNKDLARKIVRILAKKSSEDFGDSQILRKYIRDGGFFNAWIDLTSESLQAYSGPPTKRAKTTHQ